MVLLIAVASIHDVAENTILADSLVARGIPEAWYVTSIYTYTTYVLTIYVYNIVIVYIVYIYMLIMSRYGLVTSLLNMYHRIGFTDFGNEAVVIDGSCRARCDQACLDTFRWVDGTANDFTSFAVGQPDSGCCFVFFSCFNDEQDCVVIQSDGTWKDVDCALSRPAFCIVDDDTPQIEVNETLPPVSDLFPEGNKDYTGEIVLIVFVAFLSIGSLSLAGFLGYVRYKQRGKRSSLTLNPKYKRDSATSLSGDEGLQIRQTDFSRESLPWIRRDSDSKASRFSAFLRGRQERQDRYSTSTTRTDRTSAFSFGGAIMKKYFQGRRETTDSERLSQMRREQEAQKQEDQSSFGGSSYPVVSKIRL